MWKNGIEDGRDRLIETGILIDDNTNCIHGLLHKGVSLPSPTAFLFT